MSSQPSFSLKDFIPHELYKRYFKIVCADEKVFVVVIQNEDQVNTVYLEHPRPKDVNIDGLVRVFFDLAHLKRYGTQVAMHEQIHPDMVKRWELKFSELIEYVKTLDERRRTVGKPGVMAVAYSIHGEKFVELDTVWTSDKNIMV